MKPIVLIVATSRWPSTARMAVALANAGCGVEAVCPTRNPLRTTSVVRQAYPYHGLMPLMSIKNAIAITKPDFIVPGDDLATRHLHDLHHRELNHGEEGALICTLIERSLGAPENFPVVYARATFMQLAREEGIRVPDTQVIANPRDLRNWIARMSLPMVLKTNGSSGGDGVRVVHTLEAADRAFRVLKAPPLLARAGKRALVDQDKTLVWPSLLRRRSIVNAQVFVAGCEATSAIVCWKGAVLAALHFEILNKQSSTGPSTVVRLIENTEMSSAAEKMARRLHLSGLYGFDFMLEAGTQNAHLIELNPRVTQVGHLTLGSGRDLPAALYAALSGETVREAPRVTENDTIALFPQEWTRNPDSAFLRSGYHDVPWGEPEMVRVCVRKHRKPNARQSQQDVIHVLSGVRLPRL